PCVLYPDKRRNYLSMQDPVKQIKPIQPPPVRAENIPAELKERGQWFLWRYERDANDWRKVPYQTNGRWRGRSNDPSTGGTFDQAWARYQAGGFDGVAYVFAANDPYFGVDLDKCRNPETGGLSAEAWDILAALPTYTEVSPSGTGAKLIGRGKK